MNMNNPFAPPTAVVDALPSRDLAPPLWNPNAAASWSLLLSPVFGAVLHMKNWQAMGDPARAARSRNWAIGSGVMLALLSVMNILWPTSGNVDGLTRVAGFVVLVSWYYAIGKSQNAAVLARYGQDYTRKGWIKPLGVAFGVFVGFCVLAGIVAALFSGRPGGV